MNPTPLYTLYRDGVPEVQVFGEICVVSGTHILFHSAEVMSSFPARSVLKPFQFAATRLWKQAEENPKWHVAALGSISATQDQVGELQKWVEQKKCQELMGKMILPASFPMDEKHRVFLKNSGKQPDILFHTCFSKHLSILESCRVHHWPTDNYHSLAHPYHRSLTEYLEQMLGEDLSKTVWVKDGCGLPSPVLRLDQLAQLFQRLARAEESEDLKAIRQLMIENSNWIGSADRVDSRLIKDNEGAVIAKEGADGILALGMLPNRNFPEGLGIIVKVASGYHPHLAALSLEPVFRHLGLKSSAVVPQGQQIQHHYVPFTQPNSKIHDISPLLNREIAVWPGDVPFSKSQGLHVDQGDHLSLSSFHTSVHVGSHTDSPVHFKKGGEGIEAVKLQNYYGACQVIEVNLPRHQEIQIADLKGTSIVCKRILFKTRSYPDPKKFTKDFNALSRELVEYLAEKNVCLVGIDTPSIDLFESKELNSHHATQKQSMAILEGIDLATVEPGIYDLVALPLKIEGADASPVRAVLVSRPSPFQS